MRERFDFGFDFDGGESRFSRFSNEEDYCPWYIRARMDADTVHMTVSDLYSGEIDDLDKEEDLVVETDTVCFLMFPGFVRSMGADPSGWLVKDLFRKRVFGKIKGLSPEIFGFGQKVQSYLNKIIDALYDSKDLENSKSLVREILILIGRDFDLGRIDEGDLQNYALSYPFQTKVLYFLGQIDSEELRRGQHYVKKIPEINLWDVKNFLEMQANFISSALYRSFMILKRDSTDRTWAAIYDEAERILELVELLFVKVPSIRTRNQKGEVWELCSFDFFFSLLRKKLLILAEEVPQGYRDEFLDFHIPEQVQCQLRSKMTYHPWKKIK